jgi:hypothetical protein
MTVAVVSGLVTIGLGVGAGALASASHNEPSKDKPVATGEAHPTSTPNATPTGTPETSNNIESLVIPLDATPDQLGTALTAVENAAYGGDLNQASVDVVLNDTTGKGITELLQGVANENVTNVFDAQFVSNWKEDSDLVLAHDFITDRNFGRLQAYSAGQTLKYSLTLKSMDVVSKDASKTVVDITTTEHFKDTNPVNATGVEKIDGVDGTWEYTLVPQGDRLVISQAVIKQ